MMAAAARAKAIRVTETLRADAMPGATGVLLIQDVPRSPEDRGLGAAAREPRHHADQHHQGHQGEDP